jgi:dienelactone hydrolase
MVDVLLFHHSLGQTPAFEWFADRLRGAGHSVTTPDLFEGKTFETIDAGMATVESIGFDQLIERGVRAADGSPHQVVYVGISMGVLPAQKLAQTKPGALGAVFISSCVPTQYFSDGWPSDVPVRIYGTDADPIFVGEGDIEAAREIVASAADAELITYPGDEHLLVQVEPPARDDAAANAVVASVLAFLVELETPRV